MINLKEKIVAVCASFGLALVIVYGAVALNDAVALTAAKFHADIRSSYALERISHAIDEAGKEGKRR